MFKFTLWDTSKESKENDRQSGSSSQSSPDTRNTKSSPTFNQPNQLFPYIKKQTSDELYKEAFASRFNIDDLQRTISFAPTAAVIQA